MAPPTSSHRFLLLGLTLACASAVLLQAAAAMPMHPELLDFIRMPTVSLGAAEPGSDSLDTEGLLSGGGAQRRLQQNNGDLFREGGGPFTFDGFGFGYGGIFPGGGAFDGFALNIYNIIFRDILNEGLNQYLATGLSNNPLQPTDLVPPAIGNLFNRDIVALFGYDAADKFVGQWLERAKAEVGDIIPAGCVGPTYSLKVDGGSCEINDDGSVECDQPTIKLTTTPFICNLPYREAASLEGQSWRYKIAFGRERKGELGLPAGVYNFGAALNVTTPYLGFSAATRRIANDFGVQQWYQFASNLILNEILRIQAALLSGAVDDRILTADAQDAANAALVAGGRRLTQQQASSGGSGSGISWGGVWRVLLGRIASALGINLEDLIDGLQAVNALPSGVAKAASGAAGAAGGAAPKPAPKAATAPEPALKQAQALKAAASREPRAAQPEVVEAADMTAAPGGSTQTTSSEFVAGDAALLGLDVAKAAAKP